MEYPKEILLIDDDQVFLKACHGTFNGNSYHLQCVSNKQQIQQVINSSFDLIIIGSLSPVGESFRLQQWIKHHPIYKHIPVLVIDARFSDRRYKGWRVFEGFEIDAEEYVSKPLEPVELLPLIERLCMNTLNDGHQQTVETLWQAFLSLDQEAKDIFANRILQVRV